ncbi:MAG: TM2 domain-containing protein [Gammaproteobacteria bacterium]|nr:TM2 domain-containing protein [Gammaproteobacteria bacterium]
MSEYWKHQDLAGNGLQTINQQYSRLKRNTSTAFLLCALFPLGAHQFYLKAFNRGILFFFLTTSTIIAFLFSPIIAGLLLLAEIVLLIIDIINMENQIVQFNKNLKMSLSLQSDITPPKDFRGRYTNDTPVDDYINIKNNEITAFETKKNQSGKSRVYSFSEQETLLKEMSNKKKKE